MIYPVRGTEGMQRRTRMSHGSCVHSSNGVTWLGVAIAGLGCVLGPMLGGCTSSATTPDALPDAPGGVAALQMPSVSLAPAEETTMCVTLQLSNATPQMLRRI